jgi:hypothetical protein
MVPEAVQPVHDVIVALTDAFCREHLNEEYQAMCRELAGGTRPQATFAAGERQARDLGLRDRAHDQLGQLPRRQQREAAPEAGGLDKAFGVAESTGQGKPKAIRTLLKIREFDHRRTLPSRLDDTSPIWWLEVNGLIMDIRRCPSEVQEEALRKGLIPYIPADRAGG